MIGSICRMDAQFRLKFASYSSSETKSRTRTNKSWSVLTHQRPSTPSSCLSTTHWSSWSRDLRHWERWELLSEENFSQWRKIQKKKYLIYLSIALSELFFLLSLWAHNASSREWFSKLGLKSTKLERRKIRRYFWKLNAFFMEVDTFYWERMFQGWSIEVTEISNHNIYAP